MKLARGGALRPSAAGQEHKQRLSQLTQTLAQLQRAALRGKPADKIEPRKVGVGKKVAYKEATLARGNPQQEQKALMQQRQPVRQPKGSRVVIPQCRGVDDTRQRRRALDRAKEEAETERRVAELEVSPSPISIPFVLLHLLFHTSRFTHTHTHTKIYGTS